MSMNNKSSKVELQKSEKIITKYDKKVQKRREEEAKAVRTKKIASISAIIVLVAILAGSSIGLWMNYESIHGEYIVVGEESVNKIEYDYYYHTSLNNFVSQYSSYLSYFGLDTSKDLSQQSYSDTLTWDDYFAKQAVESMKQSKALVADAKSQSFEYDVTEDYNTQISDISDSAASNSLSVKAYYKQLFGNNATEKELKPIIEEYLMAAAYYEKLSTDLAATESEITATYNESKQTYDYFDYRVFKIAADTAGDATSLSIAKEKADTMLENVSNETTFASQCLVYAKDADKATYEEDTASLKSKTRLSSVDTAIKEWLSDDSRVVGDKTVIEDTSNSTYYVVYFVNRYFDDSIDDEIGQTVLNNKLDSYLTELTDGITITDSKNHLKYLTVEE